MRRIGTAHIECRECHEVIPVDVEGELIDDEGGRQYLRCEPDMADLWAHVWTHQEVER